MFPKVRQCKMNRRILLIKMKLVTPILFIFLHLLLVHGETRLPEDSLNGIDSSLALILKGLTKLTTSMEKQSLQICNKTLDPLENAHSNWNPKALYTPNEKITITCDKGFRTPAKTTKQTVNCLRGNQWSIYLPCSEAICINPPGNLVNAQSEWNPSLVYSKNDNVKVICDADFKTKSGNTEQFITCVPGDRWSDIEPCLPVCPSPFRKEGSLCILFDTIRRNWKSAKKSCSRIKSEFKSGLLQLQTEEKQNDFVYYMEKERHVIETNKGGWIGAHDLFEDGEFMWNDASELLLQSRDLKWESNSGIQPGVARLNDKENCLAIDDSGRLNDEICLNHRASFCEIPL